MNLKFNLTTMLNGIKILINQVQYKMKAIFYHPLPFYITNERKKKRLEK